MKHGEVRWYKFARPDKKRPVLILTRDSVLEYLGEVTVAPITSTVRDIPSEVFLSKADSVPQDCAVNCDHLQTVSKARIGALITSLGYVGGSGNPLCARYLKQERPTRQMQRTRNHVCRCLLQAPSRAADLQCVCWAGHRRRLPVAVAVGVGPNQYVKIIDKIP